MKQKVVIIGSSGHAKVVADIIEASGDICQGFLDNHLASGTKVLNGAVIGTDDNIYGLHKEGNQFILGIGNNKIRKVFLEKFDFLNWYTAIHPSAFVSRYAHISEGTVIMPNAVIDTEVVIGRHCIVNSGAVIEHGGVLADFVHISPNASLAGCVSVGECTQIGIGASIRENLSITGNSVIGAGSVVVRDIEESGIYVGVPVKRLR